MKILWFSNKELLSSISNSSGTWILTMGHNLAKSGRVELVNITEGHVPNIVVRRDENIVEYVLPKFKLRRGMPSLSNVSKIRKIVDVENPDLIHVWGVEKYWGLLFSRNHISGYTCLLDIQGILETCSMYYMGELSYLSFREVMPFLDALYSYSFVLLQKHRMNRRVPMENEIIKWFDNIGVQSEWVRSWVKTKNPSARLFDSLISTRKDFQSASWNRNSTKDSIVIIASEAPYKRLDVAIKAFSLVHSKYPDIRLDVVGYRPNPVKGFSRYISSLISNLHLSSSVRYMGNLSSLEMVEVMQHAYCSIVPSSVESYSMVLAESLSMGVPCVASYAGAMPEYINKSNNLSCFPSGDYVVCAERILSLIEGNENGCDNFQAPTDMDVTDNQIKIYSSLL